MARILIVSSVVAGLFLLLLILERRRPLRSGLHSVVPEVLLNLAISALAFAVAAGVVRPAVAASIDWTAGRRFGLVHLVSLPAPLRGALAFLCMDLAFYYWHRLNHVVPPLWRFHNVHHTDPVLGVSTSFRFHFGEVALSALFRVVQVTAIGIGFRTYAVYELAFQANTLFHHSNVRLPIRLERLLNRVLVTPRMHGIHHSQVREEDLSNYSVVVPWWDRLHRTLRLNVPQSQVVIGVPAYTQPEDNRFWHLVSMPFRRQRDYWRTPDGGLVEREPAQRGPDRTQLEE
ncbi:MAG TPA: sterol desaturase family protein [Thermoanaerobaculia bacterium]|jgi:sterol desaturase/sphingolipid hydroxylase (fatty acid hydroxylase superfamily)|nr:sterol desaturase family protein [Thermoanaerobaculia bacterium]